MSVYSCSICSDKFSSIPELVAHLNKHEKEEKSQVEKRKANIKMINEEKKIRNNFDTLVKEIDSYNEKYKPYSWFDIECRFHEEKENEDYYLPPKQNLKEEENSFENFLKSSLNDDAPAQNKKKSEPKLSKEEENEIKSFIDEVTKDIKIKKEKDKENGTNEEEELVDFLSGLLSIIGL